MASKSRKSNVSITERLKRHPHQFSFYQAVRLLLYRSTLADVRAARSSKNRRGIGTLTNLSDEPVRFRSQVSLGFPPADLTAIEFLDPDIPEGTPGAQTRVSLEVGFWGLIGPAGALPNHYTQLAIDRGHQKDFAIRDFLDGFSHRQLSFFFRAWEKHFPASGFEEALASSTPESDLIRESLLAIVGRGTKSVRDRCDAADDALIYYGGQFNDHPTADSLCALVADYLGLPSRVLSLFGQWLELPRPERTRLGMIDGHCSMGFDTVVGGRTWDAGSKFRIQIGPVGWKEFDSLMPTRPTLPRICQFIRSYVGMEYDFDVQVILRREEIPFCRFASSDDELTEDGIQPYLGWNTWLCSQAPNEDSEDAVFQHDGAPTI